MQNPPMPHRKDHTARNLHAAQWQVNEAETVISELSRLLSRAPHLFDGEKMTRELEVLERWKDHYHRDIVTAEAFGETSLLLLANLHDHMKLALEEIQRMESLGKKEQPEKTEALIALMHRIERIMASAIPH